MEFHPCNPLFSIQIFEFFGGKNRGVIFACFGKKKSGVNLVFFEIM
jgi:hypothetical protein